MSERDELLQVDTGRGELLNVLNVLEDANELHQMAQREGCGEGERWATVTPSRLTLALALMVQKLAETHRAELDGLLAEVKRLATENEERKLRETQLMGEAIDLAKRVKRLEEDKAQRDARPARVWGRPGAKRPPLTAGGPMRTLKTETDELPAGVQYDIIQDRFGVRRCRWLDVDGLLRSARVDGRGSLALLTHAGPIYDAHVAALGCNPEEPIPCAFCGTAIAAALTLCPECGNDPDGDEEPCDECDRDGEGNPTGYVSFSYGPSGFISYEAVCPACGGSKTVEPCHVGQREAALAKARAWQASQRENPVPAGVGGGL